MDLVGGGVVAFSSSFFERSQAALKGITVKEWSNSKFTATTPALFKSCETSWVEEQLVEAIFVDSGSLF